MKKQSLGIGLLLVALSTGGAWSSFYLWGIKIGLRNNTTKLVIDDFFCASNSEKVWKRREIRPNKSHSKIVFLANGSNLTCGVKVENYRFGDLLAVGYSTQSTKLVELNLELKGKDLVFQVIQSNNTGFVVLDEVILEEIS